MASRAWQRLYDKKKSRDLPSCFFISVIEIKKNYLPKITTSNYASCLACLAPAGAIETILDAHKNPWFKVEHVGSFLDLPQIYKALGNLDSVKYSQGKSLTQRRVLFWVALNLKISKIRRISSFQTML